MPSNRCMAIGQCLSINTNLTQNIFITKRHIAKNIQIQDGARCNFELYWRWYFGPQWRLYSQYQSALPNLTQQTSLQTKIRPKTKYKTAACAILNFINSVMSWPAIFWGPISICSIIQWRGRGKGGMRPGGTVQGAAFGGSKICNFEIWPLLTDFRLHWRQCYFTPS